MEMEEIEQDGQEVTKAHSMENPLSHLDPSIVTMTLKDGVTGTIEHFKVQKVEPLLMKWIMDLMTRNMRDMYKMSRKGWRLNSKRKEMTGISSRYLVAYIENKPVAFTHFQFDMDYGRQVLYCYEIQVETKVRAFGLGRKLMEILEKITEHAGLPLVVLTVFKFNLPGLAFFKSIGYEIDETCPEEDENKDYVILSKKVC